jgi:hypothetical protein
VHAPFLGRPAACPAFGGTCDAPEEDRQWTKQPTGSPNHPARPDKALVSWRNLGALALFLYGTTFLWLTAAFAGTGTPASGTAWTVAQLLVIATIGGFSVAAWGSYKATSWWARRWGRRRWCTVTTGSTTWSSPPPAGWGWCWTRSCTPWATRWPPWSGHRRVLHHGQSTTTLKEPTSMRTSEAPVHAAIATMTTMRMAAIQIHV